MCVCVCACARTRADVNIYLYPVEVHAEWLVVDSLMLRVSHSFVDWFIVNSYFSSSEFSFLK